MKGMRIPTSMKTEVAMPSICSENDDSTNMSGSHTKAT
jgi:hypothetical protein